jgi:hypothetical protein
MEFQRLIAADVEETPWKRPCIDCGTTCRGKRCRTCERINRFGPLTHCDCGAVIPKQHKKCGTCRPVRKRPEKVLPHNIACCKGCGGLLKIEGSYKQKRCLTCASKTPEVRAKRSASMKKTLADPVKRIKAQARMALARSMRDMSDPEPHRKQARSLAERAVAWCPEEYRSYYRELSRRQIYDPATKKCHRFGAGPARAKIERMFGGPLRPLTLTTADVALHQCRVAGEIVKLGPSQLTILLHLIGKHPAHYASNEELIAAVWPNPNMEPATVDNTLKSQILHLRRKGICIVSIHGIGYRIAPQVRT